MTQPLPFAKSDEPQAHVVTVLTPPGRGAVAVVAVHGNEALRLVGRHFWPKSRRQIEQLPHGRLVLGHWMTECCQQLDAPGGTESRSGEELLIAVRDARTIEVHCHGGTAAVQRIVDSLVAEGCRPVSGAAWLQRSETDPLVAAATELIGQTTTLRAASIVLDQVHGALSQAVRTILRAVSRGDMSQATLRLDDLLRWSALGLHLARPWRVTLIGPVNAGKSSLINAVLGYQRALVSRQAGTTRDVLTGTTACAGWPVELSDTAGLRPGTSALEREGIERAQRQAAAADLRVVVTDLTRPWTREDQLWLEQLPTPRLVVHNKCDRLGPEGRGDRPPGILTSALHARGIGELVAGIAQQLVPECPPTGTAVPLLPAHVDALRVTRQALSAGQVAIATQTLTSLFTSPI